MRVKRGTAANKRRKRMLRLAKGYKGQRHTKYRLAKQAVIKALGYAYRDRKKRKTLKRQEWNIVINAGLRSIDEKLSYSKFVHLLKQKKIELDRKILADLAINHEKVFQKIVESVR